MGFFTASIRELTNARAADVAIVDANGDHVTGFDSSRPATAVLTTVIVTTVSISLLASNAARRRFIIHNDSTGTMFVAFAATATATAFTIELAGNNTYESPLNDYTGAISAIRAVGTSNVRVTEITT